MYGLLKALTTKLQRAFVRRQYGLMLGDMQETIMTTEESGSDYDFPVAIDNDPVFIKLVSGMKKYKTKMKEQTVALENLTESNIDISVEALKP